MDGIIGLGHFCETHGPCVILSTQRYAEEPQQKPHSLIVPWCEACQSLQVDQAFLSRDSKQCYVTTRTPLLQADAFLLRQATVRSLSCELEGTRYFGDNERGHVYTQPFNVHDTLARGFQRKYCILVLMKDKLTLLNSWSMMSKQIDDIITYITSCSEVVNQREQVEKSQKSQRQAEGSPSCVLRSLTHLTKPGIYAHLHLWFTWILGCPLAVEVPRKPATMKVPSASLLLRILYQDMGGEVFSKTLMYFLHGYRIECDDHSVIDAFKSIFPQDSSFLNRQSINHCLLVKNDTWDIEYKVALTNPVKSKLQKDLESLLGDKRVTENTVILQISALVMTWIHNANVLLACPQADIHLLNSMNILKNDVALMAFIMSAHPRCEQVVANINNAFHK